MVSRKRLPKKPRWTAAGPWVLDSGAFSELSLAGAWSISAREYREEITRIVETIGNLEWASCQDWMCEPPILAKTGLSIEEHQLRTTISVLDLRSLGTAAPIIPVVQGWTLTDYIDHVDLYASHGLDLRGEPVVGLGSVCRRQGTQEASEIITTLSRMGLRLHGFGLKILALPKLSGFLASADSMAWSYEARRRDPLPGCSGHINCANCRRYAYRWRLRLLRRIRNARQD